jgi:hypothetical protein
VIISAQDQISRYQYKWMEMEGESYDNRLSKLEFFAFRHPEQSDQNILKMAMSVLETLGRKTNYQTNPLTSATCRTWDL